ncbi:MAG: ATP-binding protein [Nocardioides sp.]
MTGRLGRLPLRYRLVAGFSAAMLVVLGAAGGFVYWRVEFALDRQLDGDLATATGLLLPLVRPDGSTSHGTARLSGTELYQVLDARGRVLASSPTLAGAPLVTPTTIRAAASGPVRRDIGALLPTTRDPLRVLVTRVHGAGAGQRADVLVVAVRRDHRDEALLELLGQLAAALVGAMVVTALVGDRLARSALRPVDRYRAQADDIIAGASGVRLEVPEGRDDEVTRLGHTLNAMLDALEDALDRERHFVDDASHELRTPLTLLTTRVQLARRRPRTVAEHEEVLAEVETDVVRLVRLAEHLLDVGTTRDPVPGGTDLAALVSEEVARRNALTRAHGDGHGVQVAADGPVPVATAPEAVAQVVGNLLDNAARHGAPPVRVDVDAVAGLGRVRVVDAGPGMSPELLETATRRFTRAAESRSRDGFGLGLSLVEAVVTRAGGQLRLCAGGHHATYGVLPDGGPPCDHDAATTVTVLLPLARD